MNRIKLICIPYAGGSSSSYVRWSPYMHPDIEMIPLELAGRGRRFGEALYEVFDEAVDDVCRQVVAHIEDGADYALFGHSMGSWIAYELYYKLLDLGVKQPEHIFFSGRRAPQVKKEGENHWQLSTSEMTELLLGYGGFNRELIEDPELLALVMPMIRADFKITEQYEYRPKSTMLNCGMSVFTGRNDVDIPLSDMNEWRRLSGQHCEIYVFEGKHFFIHEQAKRVVMTIQKILMKQRMVC